MASLKMERETLLSELKKLELYDLLELYIEAKSGIKKDLEAELSPGQIDVISKLETDLLKLLE